MRRFLFACAAAWIGRAAAIASQQRLKTAWTFDQPAGQSAWMAWAFVQAGSITVPATWTDAVVTWTFDGAVDVWYSGQASLGTSSCYTAIVPPAYGNYSLHTGSTCATKPSTTPYAVGMWLWGNAAVLDGIWTLVVEYSLMPSPPLPPRSPAPAPPSPPLAPAPASASPLTWTAVADSSCSAPTPQAVSCAAGSPPDALYMPPDQVAAAPLGGGAAMYAGVFMMQAQTYTRRGYPAVLAALDADARVLWHTDLPNTPGGDACQDGGGACPSGTGLAQSARPTTAAMLLDATASQLLVGFAPNTLNSWGSAGGADCDITGVCSDYGPVVNLTLTDTRLLVAPAVPLPTPAPGVEVLLPVAWAGTWDDPAIGYGAGERGAVALMVRGCGAVRVTTDLGWSAGGNASTVATATWDGVSPAVSLDASFTVGSSTTAVALGGSVAVPAGPLSLTIRMAGSPSGCAAAGWRRVLVSGIAVRVAYDPPPSVFVVKRALGSCMRGMQPLLVS